MPLTRAHRRTGLMLGVVVLGALIVAVLARGGAGAPDPDADLAFFSRDVGAYLLLDGDGGGPHPLATGLAAGYPLSVSPDGSRVAFECDRDRRQAICVGDRSGGASELIYDTAAADRFPAWSPDGEHLAVVSSDHGASDGVYVIPADGRSERVSLCNDFCPALKYWDLVWSPDGSELAFVAATVPASYGHDQDVFTMSRHGGDLVNLTAFRGADRHPTWSPDGRQLAFASNRDGDFDLYVMRRDGSGLRRLTDLPGAEITPAWSPDGDIIAFAADVRGNWDVFWVGRDARGLQQVTTAPGDEHAPVWTTGSTR